MNDPSAVTRQQVFDFIVDYKRQHDGLSPSVTEIAKALFLHRTTARYHLMMLEHEGRIRLVGRRAIQVIGGTWELPPGEPETGKRDEDDADGDENSHQEAH